MSSYKIIPLATWKRAELFKSFRSFDDPCFSASIDADIRPLHRLAKERGDSFFLLTLFAIAKAYNAVPEMRQRFLNDDAIAEYDVVHPSVPLMTNDGENYLQTQLTYYPTFAEFAAAATPIIERVRNGETRGQVLEDSISNCFAASCVPWFSATSLTPAVCLRNQDIHVLTWFKMTPAGTVHINNRFNHCFTDGIHVGRFFNGIIDNFLHPEKL